MLTKQAYLKSKTYHMSRYITIKCLGGLKISLHNWVTTLLIRRLDFRARNKWIYFISDMLTNMANNSSVVCHVHWDSAAPPDQHSVSENAFYGSWCYWSITILHSFGGASLTANFQYFSGLRSLLHRKDDNFILFSVS